MDEDSRHERTAPDSRAWETASALRQGDLGRALRLCDDAARQAWPDLRGVASVNTTRGRVLRRMGRLDEAEEVLAHAARVHLDAEASRLWAHTELELGRCALARGQWARALERSLAAATGFARIGYPPGEGEAQLVTALAHLGLSDLAASHLHADVAHALARRLGDESLTAEVLEHQAVLRHVVGRGRSAARALEEARAAWHRMSDVEGEARTSLHLARILAERGEDPRGALDTLAHRATEDPAWAGRLACGRGAVEALIGDPAKAEEHLAEAEEALSSHPLLAALPQVDRALLDLRRGARDAALARMSALPEAALGATETQISLATLRHTLQQAPPPQALPEPSPCRA